MIHPVRISRTKSSTRNLRFVDDEGRGFAWAGEPVTASEPADDERRFYALILTVIGLLQCERRVTYRRLKYVVGIDDALVEEIRC